MPSPKHRVVSQKVQVFAFIALSSVSAQSLQSAMSSSPIEKA
jgi:hypothetical protein